MYVVRQELLRTNRLIYLKKLDHYTDVGSVAWVANFPSLNDTGLGMGLYELWFD